MNITIITTPTPLTIFTVFVFRPVEFGVLLFVSICSIPCFIFVFYQMITDRTSYRTLSNHVTILLLLSNGIQTVTDVPAHLSYYYMGKIWPFTVSYCYFYYFIDLYLFTVCFLLLTWASFERHILIFHSQFFNQSRKRLFGHYIPLGFCLIYPLIYYIIFIFFYPCENYFNEETSYCMTCCYVWVSAFMAWYEQIAHGFALMFLILIFNLALFVRVIHQKTRIRRQVNWRKSRNMIIQLFSICLLFLLTNGGYFLIQLAQMLGDVNFGLSIQAWVYPLSFLMPTLIPFIYLQTIPNLKAKIIRFIRFQNHRIIMPLTTRTEQNAVTMT